MTGGVINRALLLSLFALLVACPRREQSATGTSATTQTVAPAAAQPAPTGTDAMTQTVDVEAGRSEEDGGTASTGAAPATDTTATHAAKPPSKKKH